MYTFSMSQSERLFYIIDKLIYRGYFTLKEITEEYEVSGRQVFRDIEYLRSRCVVSYSPLDIVYDKARRGYVISEHDKERLVKWRENTLYSLAKTKEYGIGDESLQFLKKDLEYVTVKSYAEEPFENKLFLKLLNAARTHKRIRIIYPSGKVKIRILEPLRLVNYAEIWYLVASSPENNYAILTFSLSRIAEVDVLDDDIVFSDRKKLDLFLSSYGIYNNDSEPVVYTIKFTSWAARIVSRQIWQKDQVGKILSDGSFILSLPAVSDVELLSRVLFYGSEAEPVSPPSFVEKYWDSVKRMAERKRDGI